MASNREISNHAWVNRKSLKVVAVSMAILGSAPRIGFAQDSVPPPPPPPPPAPIPEDGPDAPPPPLDEPDPGSSGADTSVSSGDSRGPATGAAGSPKSQSGKKAPGSRVPPGQELVSIDFPDGVAIKDVIKAVSTWTGKNFIIAQGVSSSAKVTIISPQQVTREEAYQAFLSALNVAGFTTVDTGKAVKIVPTRSASSSNIKTFYGSSWAPMTDEIITQIIPLQYIDANTIAQQLRTILRESNPVPFSSTNSLIVSDTGHKVRRLLEIILLLDVKSNQPQVSIIPIKYTEAKDIKQKIEEIFGSGGKGSALYLQKSILDERTNSLILIGPPRGLDDVARFITRIDKPLEDASSQNQIHVRPLNYADSEKLATTLQALAQGSSNNARAGSAPRRPQPTGGAAGGGGTVADLGGVKITAEKATNSLIIQGSKSAFNELELIINQLDKRKAQVYVEADIIDVNLQNGFLVNTSVLAGVPEKALGGKFLAPFGWKPSGVAPFAVQQEGLNNTEKSALVNSIPSMAVLGILSQKTISIGGLNISPGAFIFALKEDGNSNVLQSPSLIVNDNEEANFDVTERETIFVPTEDPNTKLRSVKTENLDATLGVKLKPQISKAHEINMDLNIKAESFGRRNSDGFPVQTNKRAFTTKISVQDHQTVVISGLQRDIDIEAKQKVPLLGDIPVIGWLFRNSSSTKTKTNLMIFLTPHVVRSSTDMAKIYERKVKDQEEFLKSFYGKDFKDREVFRRMPSLDQGKVPPLPPPEPAPVESQPSKAAAPAAGGVNSGNSLGALPSEDPNPIVVPGGARSGGGGFSGGSGGAPEAAPSGDFVPPPPPPPAENQ